MFTPFYNRIIRKMVVAFGNLFNDITLIRFSNDQLQQYERITVPISYGPKEKFIERITSDPTLTKSIAINVPRISFEMTGLSYDSSRKQMTTIKSFGPSPTRGQIRTQNMGVPYDFNFSMSIYVRNIEDGTQIVEQILPYFTPEYVVTLNLIDGISETTKDIPFTLNSIDQSIDYEGDFSTTRLIIWTLDFTAKGYIFGPVSDSKLIMNRETGNVTPNTANGGIIINMYTEISDKRLQEVTLASNAGDGYINFKENEVVRVVEKNTIGEVYKYTSNTYTLTVENLTQVLVVGDLIKGDESGSWGTVESLNGTYVKLAHIDIVQNPLDANGIVDFGYTSAFLEFPDA